MTDETPGAEGIPAEGTPADAVPAAGATPAPLPPPPPVGATPPPPGAVPAPMRAKVVWPMATKVVVLGGAALLVLGSVLTWATVEASFGGDTFSDSTSGLDGDGKITLVLALAAGLVFLFANRAKLVGGIVLACGVLAGLVAVIDIVDVGNKADDVKDIIPSADASVGIGLWIAAVAAIVVIVGGALCLRQKDEAPAA